jgi:DNA-binding transcriptional MerR regulator
MAKAFYTPREVAETFGVTHQLVNYWIRTGQLEAVNVGSGEKRPTYRITQRALIQFTAKKLLQHEFGCSLAKI